MSIRGLPILGLIVLWSAGAAAQTAGEAVAVIDKSIEAHGGEQKMLRLLMARVKAKGKVLDYGGKGININFTADILVHLPGKSKAKLQIQLPGEKIDVVEVLNGRKAWRTDSTGLSTNLEDDELKATQESAHADYVTSLVPLRKEKGFALSMLAEAKVNGKPLVGVRVKAEGRADIDLYFDRESWLLVRTVRKTYDTTDMQEVTLETLYSNFKDFDGVKQPLRSLTNKDGKRYIEMDVTDVKLLDKIDPNEFHKTL